MPNLSDDKLSRLAEEAILQEAKRGALRAEMAGPSGWLKPKIHSTNKRFLKNTIKGALAANEVQDRRTERIKEAKLNSYERQLQEQKRYKRIYLHASTKPKDKTSGIIKAKTYSDFESGTKYFKNSARTQLNKTVYVKDGYHHVINSVSWNDDNGSLEFSHFMAKQTEKNRKNSILPRSISFVCTSKTNYTDSKGKES